MVGTNKGCKMCTMINGMGNHRHWIRFCEIEEMLRENKWFTITSNIYFYSVGNSVNGSAKMLPGSSENETVDPGRPWRQTVTAFVTQCN